MDVIDQAQHFAALGPVGGSNAGGLDSGPQMFREGLDATERECKGLFFKIISSSDICPSQCSYWHKKVRGG